MSETTTSTNTPSPGSVLNQVRDEIDRLSRTKKAILNERLGWPAIAALLIALGLNVWGLTTVTFNYFLIWISASLYFYIFYPLLPLILFPLRYFTKGSQEIKPEGGTKSMVTWAKNIHIIKNKRVGFRLFMRFFILSLIPLTIGMLCIYGISIVYSLVLEFSGIISADTSRLVLIQCLGIILFYIEIFFFRNHLFNFTQYVREQRGKKKSSIIFFVLLGVIFAIVGTIVVLLLIVAILLPGYTMNNFVDVSQFVKVRTNFWIALILVCQVIFMQFLQNVLSLKVGRDMCDDLLKRLKDAEQDLVSSIPTEVEGHGPENAVPPTTRMNDHLVLLRETALYAINRRQMFGLFPTYSIGLNVPSLFRVTNLSELSEVFPEKKSERK